MKLETHSRKHETNTGNSPNPRHPGPPSAKIFGKHPTPQTPNTTGGFWPGKLSQYGTSRRNTPNIKHPEAKHVYTFNPPRGIQSQRIHGKWMEMVISTYMDG